MTDAATADDPGTGISRGALNEASLLAGFGGNRQVLREVIDMFLTDGPALMTAIREAIARRDSDAAARSAHALKGSVGFSCSAARSTPCVSSVARQRPAT